MDSPRTRPFPRIVEWLALAGLSLATVALGALALWAAIVSQNGADGISRAGIQTSGHLRAVQSLSMIDTQTDQLEERVDAGSVRELRKAQRVLDDALTRMERGSAVEERQIAREAGPILRRLRPAIERFLAVPREGDDERLVAAEEEMEDIMEGLQLLLNDVDFDPSRLLVAELGNVTALERTVMRTAVALVPVGLVLVALCAWLLSTYRRRSEATMRSALELTSSEARTDQLTGLANRRALYEEFERRTQDQEPFVLAIADLNGFKQYNDTYGHLAGDALLRRLSGKLQAACAGHGTPARLGGDEFCVLLAADTSIETVETLVYEALSEEGEGFRITASCGVVTVPEDAADAQAALRLADTRMYAGKAGSRPTVEHVMSRALVQMLDERHPGLGHHVDEVARLAAACAATLGLDEDEVGCVQRAAELHDVGKLAIPEAILTNPGPLNDDEWDFMRRHPVIGERMLAVVPSMQRESALVRASHERWDGTGYPDRVAGDRIPVGARIVAVADAFSAMTEERPYAPARSVEDALAELRACAGTQFDPAVVEAFVTALRSGAAEPRAELAA